MGLRLSWSISLKEHRTAAAQGSKHLEQVVSLPRKPCLKKSRHRSQGSNFELNTWRSRRNGLWLLAGWQQIKLRNQNKIPESRSQGHGLGPLTGCMKLTMKQTRFSMFSYTRKPLVTTSAYGRGVTALDRSHCASVSPLSTGASDSDQSHRPHRLAWLSGDHGNTPYVSQSHPWPSLAGICLTSVGECSKI